MAKRKSLVCQHLENISRSALEEYQESIRHYVRHRQGVYALYRRGKLYYVGLASNLRSRLRHHLRDRHGQSWDRFSIYLTIGDSHLKELESLILRIVQPTGNKQKGKFAKSEDLRRRLARDIRSSQREELTSLLGKSFALDEEDGDKTEGGRVPVLAHLVTRPLKLRRKYKGKRLRAHVRQDGKIRFAGKIYNSPSLAAKAASGRVSCNGWQFWRYERAPGDWVQLNELRK